MLTFNMLPGDDVWVGPRNAPLTEWTQLILHKVVGRILTIMTDDTALDLDLNDRYRKVPLGQYGTNLMAQDNPRVEGEITIGIDAPDHIGILRGRVYRRNLVE